ncbi:hypothetical protein EG329_009295 [Mollisiaceae sp. DMI_Dod_QoI]|nr:hypothetical protein EG329_009295 [Helotiales sp. DMI_Dod_QoI]
MPPEHYLDCNRLIPLEEFAQHNTEASPWVAVKLKGEEEWSVYDVTAFVHLHPGGENPLLVYAGRDASSIYNRKHGDNRVNEVDQVTKVGVIDPATVSRTFELTGSVSRLTKPKKTAVKTTLEEFAAAKVTPKDASRKRKPTVDEENLAKEEVASQKLKKSATKSTPVPAKRSKMTTIKKATGRPRGRPRRENTVLKQTSRPKFNLELDLKQPPGKRAPGPRKPPRDPNLDIGQPSTSIDKGGLSLKANRTRHVQIYGSCFRPHPDDRILKCSWKGKVPGETGKEPPVAVLQETPGLDEVEENAMREEWKGRPRRRMLPIL